MKRSRFIFLTFILGVLFLSACQEQESSEGENASGEETYTIQIAYENQPDEPIHKAVERWKELADEKSDGRLQLDLFPSSQLGSKGDVIEQAMSGSNVIQIADASFMMDYVPDMGILSAPYLTDSLDEQIELTKTEWYKGLEEELEEEGLYNVTGSWAFGVRHILTNQKVTSPSDLKGLKIRVPENKLFIETFKALGATPTALPIEDLYPSLQQDLIDGAENPLPVLEGHKLQEVSNNLALSGHMHMSAQWVAGKDYIDSLPEDIVSILEETAAEAGEESKDLIEKESEKVLEEFKDSGVEVTEVDTEEFKESTKSVYDEFSEWSPGLYEEVQELLK